MAKVEIICPSCSARYQVDEGHVGRKGRCKRCDTRFVLSGSLETSAPARPGKASGHAPGETSVVSTEEWNAGDVIADLYEVQGLLGEGGMGKVYKVRHRGWNVDLAVKVPSARGLAMAGGEENFVREAETWVNLPLYPNVVQAFYVRKLDDGRPRIFAECCEGGSLKDWIAQGKCLPSPAGGRGAGGEGVQSVDLKRALDIAVQICWGMSHAHEQKLVHRDLKPANVLMTPDGTAKVTDFGLARQGTLSGEGAADQPAAAVQVTSAVGTPGYAAPEQSSSGATVDHRADVFAFGVLLWRMLGGRITWDDELRKSVVAKHSVTRMLKRNEGPSLEESVAELILRCLEPEPDDRWEDFGSVCEQLKAAYRHQTQEDYGRREPVAADFQADALNNRGVSFWDLGKMEEAEAAFEEALKLNAHHPRATLNLGLLRWRDGRSMDTEILTQLSEIRSSRADDWETAYVIGLAHLERLDAESAVENLEEAQQLGGGLEVEAALEEARRTVPDVPRFVRTFEGHTDSARSVTFSPDGRFCLSGNGVISGSDNTLRLWDVSTGQCVRTFEGHTKEVNSVAFSPDGRFCLSGSNDKTLRLWEASTGQCVRTFEGHANWVNSAAFSPDGRFCLSASWDGTLRLWDVSTGQCVHTFEGHTGEVLSVAFSPDGRFSLSGSSDTTLRLWDVSTGQCVRTFEGHTNLVTSVAFSPDGRFCLSGSNDGTLRLWDVSTGQCVRTFEGHTNLVTSVAFSPDGRFCLSGSNDKTLRLWEASTDQCVRTFEGHTGVVNSVAFSPDGRFCLSGSSDNTLRLWGFSLCYDKSHRISAILSEVSDSDEVARMDREFSEFIEKTRQAHAGGDHSAALEYLQQARNVPGRGLVEKVLDWNHSIGKQCTRRTFSRGWAKRTFEGHTKEVNSVAFSPDGRFCLSGSGSLANEDNTLRLWGVSAGQCVRTFEEHTNLVTSVAFSPDGRFCLSGINDTTLRLWDASTGRCVRTFEGHTDSARSVTFSPDGRFCLSGSLDKTLRLWDASTDQCVRTFEGHTDLVTSVAFSPDGRFCLSGSGVLDNTLRLWEASTGQCVRTFEGGASSVAFSPDGRLCLSGRHRALQLWDASTGRRVRTFEEHTNLVTSVAFSPDGRFCLSGSLDKTLRLWDASTGQCVRTFEGHAKPVSSVAFGPDGRFCLSGSPDKTLRLWEFDWEYEFPGWADWDTGAQPYLENFLTLHGPRGDDGFPCIGEPTWTEEDFQTLLIDLQHRGYGWLREEGVRKKLEEMTANWQRPPPLPGEGE